MVVKENSNRKKSKRITPSLKEWRSWHQMTLDGDHDTHRQLSAMITPHKYTQRHSSEGCLFSSERIFDLEC